MSNDTQTPDERARAWRHRARIRRLEAWGIDPAAPDADAQWSAEVRRRGDLVKRGHTFICTHEDMPGGARRIVPGRQRTMRHWESVER